MAPVDSKSSRVNPAGAASDWDCVIVPVLVVSPICTATAAVS